MTDCESIRAMAAGLAALPPADPERMEAWQHARSCPGCARVVRESERLQALLAEARPAPLPSAVMERVSRLVLELQQEARRRVAWAAAAAGAAPLLLVLSARERAAAGRDWILAAILGCAAAGLVALTRRASFPAPLAAVVAAGLAAGAAGRAGAIEVAAGAHCFALEVAIAGAVVAAGWLAARRDLGSMGRRFAVGAAAAGALAGDAALHVTCPAHASLPHLLVFHVGGVVSAAMLAGLLWRAAARARA